MITLTATVITGSDFAGWTGACTDSDLVCQVTMDAAKMTTATFVLNTYPLTVTKGANGSGVVTSTPLGIDCGDDCGETYPYGTVVTLTAAAEAGSAFGGWTEACTGRDPCVVTMDAAKQVTAWFLLNIYPFTVTKGGNGSGVVTSDPEGIFCGDLCTAVYAEGTVVTLTATAGDGSGFAGWSDACTGAGPCTVHMDTEREVTATFVLTTGPYSNQRPTSSGPGHCVHSDLGPKRLRHLHLGLRRRGDSAV